MRTDKYLNYISYLLALLPALVVISCADFKRINYESKPGENSPSLGVTIFPHEKGWADPEFHGRFVILNGKGDCTNSCHGEDFKGGSTRGCTSCHEHYPHPEPLLWQTLSGHGKYVRDLGSPSACAGKCHGEAFQGGFDPNGQKSCSNCHKSYPVNHSADDWNSNGHGSYVLSAGSADECGTKCHRKDVPESLQLRLCSDCHASYPEKHEESNWVENGHKGFLSEHGGVGAADCTKCHGTDLKGGSVGVACATSECHHKGGRGSGDWGTKEEHGSIVMTDGPFGCIKCHGADLKGNSIVRGCDDCHHQNWGESHGKPWSDVSEHGIYASSDKTTCKVCHGGDLNGGLSGVSCYPCHENTYPHVDGWKEGTLHGLVAKSDFTKCEGCHGTMKDGDCKECHHDNKPTWREDLHPISALVDTSNCKSCHGADLKGGISEKACYECHDPADAYPSHDSDAWADAAAHGQIYIEDVNNCKTACHGTDLTGGISTRKCNECHKDFPHRSDWEDVHSTVILSDAGLFWDDYYEANCINCHGAVEKATPNIPPVAKKMPATNVSRCYDCHSTYPHAGFKGTIPGAGDVDIANWRSGHWYFLMYNREYSAATAGGKIALLRSSDKGCVSAGGGCHLTSRHGPVRSYSAFCKSMCHR